MGWDRLTRKRANFIQPRSRTFSLIELDSTIMDGGKKGKERICFVSDDVIGQKIRGFRVRGDYLFILRAE